MSILARIIGWAFVVLLVWYIVKNPVSSAQTLGDFLSGIGTFIDEKGE